jgi:organic radical activating enzyme
MYLNFAPDLIVEVTSVCDRACPGCYAPNLLSAIEPRLLVQRNSSAFIDLSKLQELYATITGVTTRPLKIVAIRGGEPTRHPEIANILEVLASPKHQTFLETHGRWILDHSSMLLETCVRLSVILKISFDEMHALSPEQLFAICTKLDAVHASWVIAITEPDTNAFAATRETCKWIPDERIIYQAKVANAADLIVPPLGVIKADGTTSSHLTTKDVFC